MDETNKRTDMERKIALDARDWIVRLASGDVSDAELDRFKAWRDRSAAHRQAFERERVFWRQLQVLDGRSDGMPPFAAPSVGRGMRVGRRAFLIGGGAAAAAAVAAIAAPPLLLRLNADFITPVGRQADIRLPDGSVAALNTDSAISISFTPHLRLVSLLKGEAEFDVRPNPSTPFRVAALGGNSDTDGSAFSVSALHGIATVTVREGHVRVAGPAAPTAPAGAFALELSARQQTSYVAGDSPSAAADVDTDVVMAWRSGRLIFEARPFSSAIAELGRYLPERIVLGPGARRDMPVSAIFSTANALDAVQALARTQGLAARRIPGLMILIA